MNDDLEYDGPSLVFCAGKGWSFKTVREAEAFCRGWNASEDSLKDALTQLENDVNRRGKRFSPEASS